MSHPEPTRESGERRELPRGVRGKASAENGFWHILKATERSCLYLYDTIRGRQFALVSPTPNYGGLVPLVIYAHVCALISYTHLSVRI